MPHHRGMYSTKRWGKLRRAVLRRDDYRCQACKKLAGARPEIDHVKPVEGGGALWDMDNLQTLCRDCHFNKTASENGARHVANQPESVKEWRGLVNELTD